MARRRTGFQKKIDTVHWTLGQEVFVSQGAGTAAVNLLAAQHLPETLLRIRGEWVSNFAQALASAVGVVVTMGIIQVPEGTGTTVLWSPNTDGDAPWIWWDSMQLIYREYVTDTVWSSNTSDGRRVIDSKAMRKIRNTELQVVVENATITGLSAANIDASLTVRVLAGS